MKAQRIHCFAGVTYYPWGGMSDYIGSFATTDEAWTVINSWQTPPDWVQFCWMKDDGSLDTFLIHERDKNDILVQVPIEEHHQRSIVFK